MLKIYGRANSINVRKVLWTADEIGIPYEREDWGRGFEPLTNPAFLAVNELALIPAIDDDGFLLSESNTVIRYLAAKHGRTDLLPADPQGRAVVERWMDWQATELYNAMRAAFVGLVLKGPVPGGDEAIQASLKAWPAQMEKVESQLRKTGAYITGADFNLADVSMGLAVNRWFATELPIERPEFPATSAYYDLLSQRPAFIAHGRNGTP
ncbi:MAG: glutathione S-transferase family protein [Rhodomicrobiaceae bacterium]